ncbi:MAG TPA: dihydrofolate reductase family protein [Anaerolineales bacterium]|jgi:dihydrofolate reductase
MRKVYLFNLISLDGFFEGPNHDINWHNVDDEFNEFAIKQLTETDLILFGRVTYQMMANYWPTPEAIRTDPIVAGLMNSTQKIVFSKTLNQAGWENTRLVKEHAAEELTRLKSQPGKEIAIFGSAILASRLLKSGVIDEYRLLVNPLVLGSGTALFKPEDGRQDLKLVNTRMFMSGNVMLYYQPKGNQH